MIKPTFPKTSPNISSHCLDEGEKAKGKVGKWERGEAEHSVKEVSKKCVKKESTKVSKSVKKCPKQR